MPDDHFSSRFAQVRARFAAKLDTRIAELNQAVGGLSGDGRDAEEAVTLAHRHAHDLCGISPAIGFTETGRAARSVEQILRASLHSGQGLTPEETERLQNAIKALRIVAQAEIQMTASVRQRAQ
jgi:HPt (histidine-containing phosphotransfer) domain-containing protein